MPDMDVLADCLIAASEAPIGEADAPLEAEASALAAPAAALVCASVTREQESLSRMIGRGASIALAGHEAILHFQLASDQECEHPGALVLEGAFGAIELAQGVRFLRALTGIDVGAELDADEARWEWLQAALVARLDGTPFAGAERILRTALPDGPDNTTLRITLRTANHAIATLGRASADSWLDVRRQGAWRQERQPFSEFAEVPHETVIRVARHTLPRHALNGLGAGDILLPDNAAFGTRGGGYVQFGMLRARVRFQEPSAFKITDLEIKLDALELNDDMHDGAAEISLPADVSATAEGPDNTPVTLDFELGKVRMSLGEMRALQPDSVVAFQGSPAAIAIRCRGLLLGRGELVDVNARLGVRIVAWEAQR